MDAQLFVEVDGTHLIREARNASTRRSIEVLWPRVLRRNLEQMRVLSRLAHFAGNACGIVAVVSRSLRVVRSAASASPRSRPRTAGDHLRPILNLIDDGLG
jgi:hypothetical protein